MLYRTWRHNLAANCWLKAAIPYQYKLFASLNDKRFLDIVMYEDIFLNSYPPRVMLYADI